VSRSPVPDRLEVVGLPVPGEIVPGVDLVVLVLQALADQALHLQVGDVIVVAQKAVSKAEGRLVRLADVEPSPFARDYARTYSRDARLVEVVLRESRRIVRMDRGVLIVETHHGYVCANAGVDLSNVSGGDIVCLLPVDPDRSAAELRAGLQARTGMSPAIIVSDTFGRPWRNGLTNVALGAAGIDAMRSHIGERDSHGYDLRLTELAIIDEIASAAELVMGKTEGRPFALVRGYPLGGEGTGSALIRDAAMDLFR
jgi:coenzyme F420-0:L-glutamate ligase / coenzyme F420-1:gamma-L-glutamate ligase